MNLEYIFAAYALVMIALFVYIASFNRRQRRLEREIDSLRRLVEGDKGE